MILIFQKNNNNAVAKITRFFKSSWVLNTFPEHMQHFVVYAEVEFILYNIVDYSLLKMGIVFSGDAVAENCFTGVCKISREWLVTAEHVLRIATIYHSYSSIFLLPSSFSYHPFLFSFSCFR